MQQRFPFSSCLVFTKADFTMVTSSVCWAKKEIVSHLLYYVTKEKLHNQPHHPLNVQRFSLFSKESEESGWGSLNGLCLYTVGETVISMLLLQI